MAHPLFENVPMPQLHQADFDERTKVHESELVGIFFWGHNCPNCEVAKKMLSEESQRLKDFQLTWFHVNTYEDFDLGVRFGLHGIPTFLFFKDGKKLGRISPFPGTEAFFQALAKLREQFPN